MGLWWDFGICGILRLLGVLSGMFPLLRGAAPAAGSSRVLTGLHVSSWHLKRPPKPNALFATPTLGSFWRSTDQFRSQTPECKRHPGNQQASVTHLRCIEGALAAPSTSLCRGFEVKTCTSRRCTTYKFLHSNTYAHMYISQAACGNGRSLGPDFVCLSPPPLGKSWHFPPASASTLPQTCMWGGGGGVGT